MGEAVISRFRATGGTQLYYEWWMPVRPKGLLLLVHGISEHSGRYGPFIRYFVDQGYGVAVYDQRGHGQSGGRRGHIDHFQDLLGDLAQFVQMTRERYPDVPMFLVGHSFGGQVVLNFVVRYSKGLRGLIVSSPNIALRLKIAAWKRWLVDHCHAVAPHVQVAQRIDPTWLSKDEAVSKAYREDPRVLPGVTLQMSAEIIRNLDLMMALASRIHIPTLFMHAGDDRICDPEATRRFYRRIPVMRKRLKVYEGMRHELFNEVAREMVFRDVHRWIDELLATEWHGERVEPAGVVAEALYVAPHQKIARGERWEGTPS